MENLFDGIYKGKTVLVTGHTGFKGSWLCLWLEKLGSNVVGYSLEAPSKPNHFSLLNLKMDSVIGDIRDRNNLQKIFEKYKPDVVFHLAAQSLVRYSYDEPVETYETNVMGTLNVFEASRKTNSVKAIVNVTSDKCYENKEWIWGYRENDPMGGFDPYSSSKGCSELLTSSYRNSFFPISEYGKKHNCLLASARAGNVIGGGDWSKDRLVPDIVKSYSKDEIVIIRNPDATRPWQHVLDPLSGYLILGKELLLGNTICASSWNFGPDHLSIKTVKDFLLEVKKNWLDFEFKIDETSSKPHEAQLLKLDSSKANNVLNWTPRWNFEESLKFTTEWYKLYNEIENVISNKQLEIYVEKILR